ncbi:MAG: transposase [Lacipirellulaceae bacterium]
MSDCLWPLQVFDPASEFTVVERKLPHWAQAGTVCFMTWRTIDSIPRSVLRRWRAEQDDWLWERRIDPRASDWKTQLKHLDTRLLGEFTRKFARRWHRHLDNCHGDCLLREPCLARIVSDSLLKFDGDRYQVTDFIVMPNHVHLLASFADAEAMLKQCAGWKHYHARLINKQVGRSGHFWQQDGFDHLVRSVEQYEALRRYIASNGDKAGLKPGEYLHFTSSPIAPR